MNSNFTGTEYLKPSISRDVNENYVLNLLSHSICPAFPMLTPSIKEKRSFPKYGFHYLNIFFTGRWHYYMLPSEIFIFSPFLFFGFIIYIPIRFLSKVFKWVNRIRSSPLFLQILFFFLSDFSGLLNVLNDPWIVAEKLHHFPSLSYFSVYF